jgi:hypothetical protein
MRIPASLLAVAAPFILFTIPSVACAATSKACDLLSPQTAASLAGGPVNAPVEIPGMGCLYSAKTGAATVGLSVNDVQGTGSTNFTRQMQMSVGQGATMEQIPGLGEQSGLVVRTSGDNSLTVLYHQKTLTLSAQKKMTPELKAAMVEAMKQILTKL